MRGKRLTWRQIANKFKDGPCREPPDYETPSLCTSGSVWLPADRWLRFLWRTSYFDGDAVVEASLHLILGIPVQGRAHAHPPELTKQHLKLLRRKARCRM